MSAPQPGAAPVRLPGVPDPPPLALYVHLPWCERKCPYCDFNSHAAPERIPEDRYLEALRLDLESWLPQIYGRGVASVFIGGGTPSLFSVVGIERLLSDIRMLVALAPGAEITMEANPGSVEAGKFRGYADAGVNRLSLGIQSLDDANLRSLGRVHNATEALKAAAIATAAFARVNFDMITALPGQTAAAAIEDARRLCDLGAEHLSLYRLTREPGTPFFRAPPPGMLDEDAAADCEDVAREELIAAGYQRYEISAHAKDPESRAGHNLNYWQFGDYLGIGAGAHAKLSTAEGVLRSARHKAPPRYMEHALRGEPAAESSKVAAKDLPFEFMLNALRLTDGFSEKLFESRTGLPLRKIEGQLAEAQRRGWISRECGIIAPTSAGLDFHNDLCALFLPG